MAKKYYSDEFYVENADGTRSDAALHADMLEGPHAEAADRLFALQSAIRSVEEDGWSEETAARLYGIDLAELQEVIATTEGDAFPDEDEGEEA